MERLPTRKSKLLPYILLLITILIFGTPLVFSQVVNHLHKPTLRSVLSQELQNQKGTYAVVVKNLKTHESYFMNEHVKLPTASLYKLWVMATAFDQIQQSKLNETEVLSGDVTDINQRFRIASDEADLQDGQITLTITDALKQMITISHNYAALLLTERESAQSIEQFLKMHNLTESSLGNGSQGPTTTAYDIAQFLEQLYKGKLVDEVNTIRMLALLKQQQLNTKLPRLLPDSTPIAHKTGELGMVSHDAGIVYTKHGDFIIVVMTQTENPAAADDKIARLSQVVYDYFITE